MKKLLFILLFVPSLVHAGSITTVSTLGTITMSTGAYTSSVSYDSSTWSGSVSGASPLTFPLTIGTNYNRLLLVGCGILGADVITGVTAGGNAMTLVSSITAGASVSSYIYQYPQPNSGSQSIAVSINSGVSNHALCTAISYYNVSQNTPIDVSSSAITYVFNTSFFGANVVTTTANDALFDFAIDPNNGITGAASGQTPIVMESLFGAVAVGSSSSTATTAGSYNVGYSGFGGSPVVASLAAIKPSPTP